MKSGKEFRGPHGGMPSPEDSFRRAQRLEPNKKNGKERHTLLGDLDMDEEMELDNYKKRESAFDYLDD